MRRFLADFLFILAAWTLTVKFVLPISWAVVGNLPLNTFIYWDFWWVVHIWLGYALLTRPKYLLHLALVVSVAEIGIVAAKFLSFFSEPVWTVWSMNWFVNKVFVLLCFVLLFLHAAFRSDVYRRSTIEKVFEISENKD